MVDDLEQVLELNPRNGIVIKRFDPQLIDSSNDLELHRLGKFLHDIRNAIFTEINLSDQWAIC